MIIAVANSKGGVGKSTVSVHLAAWLESQGFSVVLADCDTQHSSSEWIQLARPNVSAIRLASPDAILNGIPEIAEEADVVVCDGPGSQTETSRALLLVADLAILPCKASMLEVRALANATEFVRQAQKIRHGLPQAVAVLSMVGQKYRLTQDMKEAAAALNLQLASHAITLRQIYADAPGQGQVISDMGNKAAQASHEIDLLFAEIFAEHKIVKNKAIAKPKTVNG